MKTIQFKALLLAALVLANPVAMHAQSKTDKLNGFFQLISENKKPIAIAIALFATVAGFYYGYIPNPFSSAKPKAKKTATASTSNSKNPVTSEQGAAPAASSVLLDAAAIGAVDAQAAADLERENQAAQRKQQQAPMFAELKTKHAARQKAAEELARQEAETQAQAEKEKIQRAEEQNKILNETLQETVSSQRTTETYRAANPEQIKERAVLYMVSLGENAIANRIGEAVRDSFMAGGTDEQIRATLISKIDDLNTQELLDKTDYDDARIDELIKCINSDLI